MNYPILANRAWLAIPADADEESARAAAAAILWLYTSKAGESALIDTLDLITPWGTGSNQNAAAAMQAAQVTAGNSAWRSAGQNPGRRIAAGPARAVL